MVAQPRGGIVLGTVAQVAFVLDVLDEAHEMPCARIVVRDEQVRAVPRVAVTVVVRPILRAHLRSTGPGVFEHPAHVVHIVGMHHAAARAGKLFQVMRYDLRFDAVARTIDIQQDRVGVGIVVEAHLVRHLGEQPVALVLPRPPAILGGQALRDILVAAQRAGIGHADERALAPGGVAAFRQLVRAGRRLSADVRTAFVKGFAQAGALHAIGNVRHPPLERLF